jgi:hypothetical protein
MLYITLKTGEELHWHITKDCPIDYSKITEIQDIQADGDELSYIIIRFKNLIIPQHRKVVRWFGDTAQHIVGNLW